MQQLNLLDVNLTVTSATPRADTGDPDKAFETREAEPPGCSFGDQASQNPDEVPAAKQMMRTWNPMTQINIPNSPFVPGIVSVTGTNENAFRKSRLSVHLRKASRKKRRGRDSNPR